MAKIEFYIGNSDKFIETLVDGAVPREGEFVNIRKVTYQVDRVTWAVDDPKHYPVPLRANVELSVPAPQPKAPDGSEGQ